MTRQDLDLKSFIFLFSLLPLLLIGCGKSSDDNKNVLAETLRASTLTVIVKGSGSVNSKPAGINCGSDCSGSYTEGERIKLKATPESGYRFIDWSGDCFGVSDLFAVVMDGDKTCTANFTNIIHTLTITTKNGSITSQPAGIHCSSDCSGSYTEGKKVVLKATPESGYLFSGWRGDCSGSGNPFIVTIDRDKTCVADFESPKFKLPSSDQTGTHFTISSSKDTVADGNTGLVWQKNDMTSCVSDSIKCRWREAQKYCKNLNLGKRNDWRLPNRLELLSIVDYSKNSPASYENYFRNIDSMIGYWSSDSNEDGSTWYVEFASGSTVLSKRQNDKRLVRCVRGKRPLATTFTDNEDGTVTDSNSGLLWQKDGKTNCKSNDDKCTQKEAVERCKNLNLAGKDWRLPNIQELGSIVDLSKSAPTIQKIFTSVAARYWSSTVHNYYTDKSWYVDFESGSVNYQNRVNSGYVRCVYSEE